MLPSSLSPLPSTFPLFPPPPPSLFSSFSPPSLLFPSSLPPPSFPTPSLHDRSSYLQQDAFVEYRSKCPCHIHSAYRSDVKSFHKGLCFHDDLLRATVGDSFEGDMVGADIGACARAVRATTRSQVPDSFIAVVESMIARIIQWYNPILNRVGVVIEEVLGHWIAQKLQPQVRVAVSSSTKQVHHFSTIRKISDIGTRVVQISRILVCQIDLCSLNIPVGSTIDSIVQDSTVHEKRIAGITGCDAKVMDEVFQAGRTSAD